MKSIHILLVEDNEGDILLTHNNLNEQSQSPNLRIAEVEHYRTVHTVRTPRTVTISVTNLTEPYSKATDLAIQRYNNLNLKLKFKRVSSNGNIDIVGIDEPAEGGYITLGSSGFPTSSGSAYEQVLMNTNPDAYGDNPNVQYLASVLTHEIGHCIGMRHTDYMNRSYSCNGTKINEGWSEIGAVRIDGTPSKPDSESWMLSCSNGGNRVFNENDIVALRYLYQK